ncbi:MAG: alpha/beta hydrolase [Ruminococcus sp.]|nr:alpha/beta hydrolase [Ruminococcus sp.]MCM1381835.1 alpha/beta hydrolase [Muribaculaceae bacterium]MCM1479505.1 alpha/beta hydrolase [Muribaculaceae bacterium]
MKKYGETEKIYASGMGAKLFYRIIEGARKAETPFVLIHGQCMCGLDYEKVLDKLSEKYTLYLIDCFGHGESEKNEALYRCGIIGNAAAELIREVIAKPCLLSGHSSGGIIAAYTAGIIPELVKGVVLEDPPFFNVLPDEMKNTFVYKDAFLVNHGFLNKTEEEEYLVYYLKHGYIFNYLGDNFFGKDWVRGLAEEAAEKLKAAPGTVPELKNVSAKSLHGLAYMDKFDLLFSESFYTGKWFEGVEQEDILKSVKCPAVYLKTKTKYGKDGVLWAANSDDSAERVMKLLENGRKTVVKSGHDIHFEKPSYFIKAVKVLEKMMK